MTNVLGLWDYLEAGFALVVGQLLGLPVLLLTRVLTLLLLELGILANSCMSLPGQERCCI